jgi:hypothetical protein
VFTVVVDTATPAAPVITAITEDTGENGNDGITNDPTLILSGTAEANSVVELSRAGTGVIGTAIANGSGNWSFDYTAVTLPDGSHDFTATASDAAGNTGSASAVFNVIVDTASPAAPVIMAITEDTGSNGSDGITNDPTLILSGTAEANSMVELTRAGTGVIGTAIANGSGNWSFDYTAVTLPDGSHDFTALATDTAGNTGATSAVFTVVVDAAAPAAPVITAITEDTGSNNNDGRTSPMIWSKRRTSSCIAMSSTRHGFSS